MSRTELVAALTKYLGEHRQARGGLTMPEVEGLTHNVLLSGFLRCEKCHVELIEPLAVLREAITMADVHEFFTFVNDKQKAHRCDKRKTAIGGNWRSRLQRAQGRR